MELGTENLRPEFILETGHLAIEMWPLAPSTGLALGAISNTKLNAILENTKTV